jgi:hypothetical protein
MKMNQPYREPAELEIRRPARIISRSIPISAWRDVTFKVNVRRFKSQSGTRSASQTSIVQMNPRATLISRC